MLLNKGKITKELIAMLSSWRHSGFNIFCGNRIVPKDETMMDFIAYADGKNDLIEISNIIGKPVWEIVPIAKRLLDAGLLEEKKRT
jgi:aminopeptidase-like protein